MRWIDVMNQIYIIQTIIFILLLIYSAITDIRTRTIPDHIPLLIILIGLIGMEPIAAFLGLMLVPLPYFLMALIKENSIGGGDIKLMGACGLYLGVHAGYFASMLGLLLAIVIHSIYGVIVKKKINKSIPLAPYLGMGCLVALIVFNL